MQCRVTRLDFFGPVNVTLNCGEIDHTAIEVFTMGQCHALALALNQRTQWEIAGIYSEDDMANPSDERTPKHVICVSPYGFVDIEGIGANVRWMKPGYEIYSIPRKTVLDFENRDYIRPNLIVAESFVDPVLRLVENQRKSNSFPRKSVVR